MKVEPLGLEYLISSLEQSGFKAALLDATIEELNYKQSRQRLIDFKPDIVGLSITTPGLVHDAKAIGLVKECLPLAKIVVGGPHPSADPKGLLTALPDIDYAVIGEGERTIVELVRAIEEGGSVSGISGIAYRQDGEVVISSPRELIEDIDILPFPDRDYIDYRKVCATLPFGRRHPFAIMITGRGCPYGCIFCSKSVFGRGCRLRSPENVLQEIEALCRKGIKEIRFYDDIFTINPARAIKICQGIIDRKFDLVWSCESRVDTISEEVLVKLKEAGCYSVSFGVESGAAAVLAKSGKNITIEQIRKAFSLCQKVGMETGAWFIFGLPGETPETIEETLKLIKEIRVDFVAAGMAGLLPQTELYDQAKREGAIKDAPWYDYAKERTSPVVDGYWKRYTSTGISEKQVAGRLKSFYLSYYLEPRRLWWFARHIKDLNILMRGGGLMWKFLLQN